MSDITDLFSQTASATGATPDAETVDADLARGQFALRRDHRRRTVRRSMAATSTVAAVAVVAVIVAQATGTSSHNPTASHPTAKQPAVVNHVPGGGAVKVKPIHRIKLVAYHGKQLNGFTVDSVPAGWQLSTSTQYALLITKDGSTDDDPSAFVGKLAVLTSSIDEHGLGKGDHVTVNGQPGRVDVQGDVQLLRYNSTDGFGVDIQAPTKLHWTDAQIVKFAEGVHVTGNAVHSEG
jgi:hypothetical protein